MGESFKKWLELQEAGTSTADIAGFQRPIMGAVRRTWPCESGKCVPGGAVQMMTFGSWKDKRDKGE